MELLSPDTIRKDRSESNVESQERSRALAAEESRLARGINLARQNADEQIRLIDEDWKIYKAEKQEEAETIRKGISALRSERAELLKPIDEIKANAEKILSAAELRAADVEKAAGLVQAHNEKNQENAEMLKDRSDELDQREEKIKISEHATEQEKIRQQNSAKELADGWIKHSIALNAVAQEKVSLEAREGRLSAETKANEARAQQLDKRETDLNAKETGLRSGYEALAAARKEILGRDD